MLSIETHWDPPVKWLVLFQNPITIRPTLKPVINQLTNRLGAQKPVWFSIWLFNSSPWKDPPFLIGKPSINGPSIPWLC